MKYHTIEEIECMNKISYALNTYHVPYNKLVMLMAGLIIAASFAIPFAFPVPAGIAVAGCLLRRFG